jgi:predicted regulator of Ras-like GTPase activity (Roadblock/LC7/MglB family)
LRLRAVQVSETERDVYISVSESRRFEHAGLTLFLHYAKLHLHLAQVQVSPHFKFFSPGWQQSWSSTLCRRVVLSKSRTQQMVDRLRELQASSPDIEASAVVSVDGLSIASALPQGVEEDRVSAMSAAMLSLGERIATELGRGTLEQVYVKGEKGYVILMSVGEEAVLTALAREQAKLGLILLDMRRATEDLSKLI